MVQNCPFSTAKTTMEKAQKKQLQVSKTDGIIMEVKDATTSKQVSAGSKKLVIGPICAVNVKVQSQKVNVEDRSDQSP